MRSTKLASTKRRSSKRESSTRRRPVVVPRTDDTAVLEIGGKMVRLTNLGKIFWRELGLRKGDLLRYYVRIADVLLPHLRDRAMVMKRYPNGADGPFFFMKRVPSPRPEWVETCRIAHGSGSVIEFPMIQDLAALLWVVNLGCIDLNQWYARCDDVDRPDYLHFDLDPGPEAGFDRVRDTAAALHDAFEALKMPSFVKTSGSRGMHVYVPIVRGPVQKAVWGFAKALAHELAARHPALMTAEYRLKNRPRDRVLVDYNQNAWGRTLASVYSVRPTPVASVSTPLAWSEIRPDLRIDRLTIRTVPSRIARLGDLWHPLVERRGRFNLGRYL